jgi:putative DNA primase/helicase
MAHLNFTVISSVAQTVPLNKKQAALALAKKGLHIGPLCWPNAQGRCACSKQHTGHDVGKAPLLKRGVNDFSNSIKKVWGWWEQYPEANIGVDLGKSGLIAIAPDSPDWHDIFKERGLPDTTVVQSGGGEGHLHYYYRRPEETPLTNINIPDAYDIQPRGYVVAAGSLHKSGRTYEWASDYVWRDVEDLPFAPEWALEEIRQKWEAHSAAPEIDVDLTAFQLRPELLKGTLEE